MMMKCLILLLAVCSLSVAAQSGPYPYRGAHLDVCRHFFPKETILCYLDTLASCGMNYFHWHLTDDQGWRLEIKQYPRLTEIGAWRKEKDGTIYGGFYTQQDVREIVAYAAGKGITVIPEIDMPGHASAAVAAYPWLSCANTPVEVPSHWGVFPNICSPDDSVFHFLQNVLDEVCELFPSHYIHIGGDEVPKQQWKDREEIQQYMLREKLRNYEELQHHFMLRIENYLLAKGRRSIVWGEAIRGGINDSTIVISWRGRGAGIKAARHGNAVIMAPRFSCYLDYPASLRDKKHAWWMTYVPVRKVARFKPHCKALSDSQNNNIIGAEVTLWTEYVTDEKNLWHQLMPRLKAFGAAMGKNK